MPDVPQSRIRPLNTAAIHPGGQLVLYWMVATRRLQHNFALQRAVEHARQLHRPLVILEALRCDYRWACDRFHGFILDGMRDHRALLARRRVLYHPYVELERGQGKGLLAEIGRLACVVVTDDFPTFFFPRMLDAAAHQLTVRLEAVDSAGIMPIRLFDRAFPTAHAFRRQLQRRLPAELGLPPAADPLRGLRVPRLAALPRHITRRWPAATPELLAAGDVLARLPIDHAVGRTTTRGGHRAAQALWRAFLQHGLLRYHDQRNDLDHEATSQLSAHLHFGHIGSQQLVHDLLAHEGFHRELLSPDTRGRREGWWGLSPGAEAFLDQLITWRELGFNMCAVRADHDQYRSLPPWARETLAQHQDDPRPRRYTLEQFEQAATHDPLWNAAQRQLQREGRIHNYLRMLWGKKILQWTRRPREALRVMIELNNRLALDGRDPNSYSGIFWILGRYDRAWGPQRPVFGKVRYMSSDNTRRKLRVQDYLQRHR